MRQVIAAIRAPRTIAEASEVRAREADPSASTVQAMEKAKAFARLPARGVARGVAGVAAIRLKPATTTSTTSMAKLRSLLSGSTRARRTTVAKWTPCAATKAIVHSVLRFDNAIGRGARATRAMAATRPEKFAE